jgi:hypothetical protein
MRWNEKQREGFGKLLYTLQKIACNNDDFLKIVEECGLSEEDWKEIKIHLKNSYGFELYV